MMDFEKFKGSWNIQMKTLTLASIVKYKKD
jgi:hypothetical protein